MVISNENIKVRSYVLLKQVRFVTQAAMYQVLSLKNVPLESARFSAVRSFIRCALRLKNGRFVIAQLVARYLGVTMTARSIVDHCATP